MGERHRGAGLQLTAAVAKRFREGTHRAVAPSRTLARLAPLHERLGITRVADLTGLDRIGLPVAMAVRPGSFTLSVHMGKGATPAAAAASAVMEACELHAAESFRPAPAPPDAPALLPRRRAGRRFDPAAPGAWAPGTDLIAGGRVRVPCAAVRLDRRVAAERASAFHADSNGLASGNTRDEAVLHAVCELVERDARALFELEPPATRAARVLDLAAVGDRLCAATLARFAAAGIATQAWDITSDIGVPAFFCVIDDYPGGRPPFLGRFGGAGCHPNPGVALFRAMSEAAQSRLGRIAGARDDLSADHASAVGWQGNIASIVFGGRQRPARRLDAVAALDTGSIAGDLAAVVARLGAHIRHLAVVDLTDPAIGVPAVRAIAPELEGIDHMPGYRPGARARRIAGRTMP